MGNPDKTKIHEIINSYLIPEMKDQLLQVILYNDKDPHSEDVLIITQLTDLSKLKQAQNCVSKLMKKNIPAPFFMTPEFITSSLDSYPLEFLNIQTDYQNIWQKDDKDYLKNLHFDKQWVRLQVERELKGKYLLISTHYMAVNSSVSRLKQLVSESILSLKPVLKGILFLFDEEISPCYEDLISRIEGRLNIELRTLSRAFDIRFEKISFKQLNSEQFFENYLKELEVLFKKIEQ
ncbi:MAG TPA: hypothetical protein PKJ08_03505 [Candidatus Cloacimonadota bacterium]|nr:hypothetical protein [Candidatus Cloacimonadota bacterium]